MTAQYFEQLRDWFGKYVQSFYSDDADIQAHVRLKEDHTERVCAMMQQLAVSLRLDAVRSIQAATVALLHDIGRFSQYHRYRTFNDFRSENHACLGVRVLRQTGVLADLPDAERDLILKAVRYHNDRDVPPDDPDAVFLAKMIRDVDKVDILQMVIAEDEAMKMLPSPEFGVVMSWSADMAATILGGQVGRYEHVRSVGDQMLFRMSWLYDMNFPWTFQKVRELNLLEKMSAKMPADPEIINIVRHLKTVRDQHG